MATLTRVVTELQSAKSRLEKELEQIGEAIGALTGSNGRGRGRRRITKAIVRPRRQISVAGRRRIAEAQKARWAKLRAKQAKKAA